MAKAERGEVWLIDLGEGYVPPRAYLVLLARPLGEGRALTTLASIGTKTSGRFNQFEIPFAAPPLVPDGVVHASGVFSTTKAKLVMKLGDLAADEVEQVEDAALLSIGF
jgi:mRNA-degrading endonuclease toxin of MazEF toxin-antitoxin module